MAPTDRAVSRVLLVADRRDTVAPRDPNAPRIRRYRLARLRLTSREGRSSRRPERETELSSRADRHARLRRLYD